MPLQEKCVLFGAHLLSRKWYTSNTPVCQNCVRCTLSFKIDLSKTIDCSASKACDFDEASFWNAHLQRIILSDCIDSKDYFQSTSAFF